MSNMKFSGKIIISDVDGTYTGSAEGIKRNNEAIEYFKKNGGLFTFASGRGQLGSIVPEYKSLVNAPLILCNGSYVYDEAVGEKKNEICVDSESSYKILDYVCENYPSVTVYVSCQNGYLNYSKAELGTQDGVKSVDVHKKESTGNWNKIILECHEDGVLDKISRYIDENANGVYAKTFSCSVLLELLSPLATKGNQVKYLKTLLGNVKTYCIGDYENDENMLASADVSAAPCSGLKKIVDMCDHVVCANTEGAIAGLVELIEKEVQNEMKDKK